MEAASDNSYDKNDYMSDNTDLGGDYLSSLKSGDKESPPKFIQELMRPLAFTWCPCAKYHSLPIRDQFKETFKLISKYYNAFDLKNTIIYPELTKIGNIHYHATLYIKDRYKFYEYFLPLLRRHGLVKLKVYDGKAIWDRYICKDGELMRKLLRLPEDFIEKGLVLKQVEKRLQNKIPQCRPDIISDLNDYPTRPKNCELTLKFEF